MKIVVFKKNDTNFCLFFRKFRSVAIAIYGHVFELFEDHSLPMCVLISQMLCNRDKIKRRYSDTVDHFVLVADLF